MHPDFTGELYDYQDMAINAVTESLPDFKMFLGAMPSWDNTARRGSSAHAFINSNPDLYEFWLRGAIEKTKQRHSGDEQIVFINAWNEWAEGAHLEPDQKYGHSHLLATRKALKGTHSWRTTLGMLRYLPNKSAEYLEQLFDELEKRTTSQERSIQALYRFIEKVVTVTDINLYQQDSKLLWNLELPTPGIQFDVNSIVIQGWLISAKSPVVSLEVTSNDKIIQTVPVNIQRPDVAEAYTLPESEQSGFLTKIKLVELISEVDIALRVVLKDGSYIPLALLRLEPGYKTFQSRGIALDRSSLIPNSRSDIAKTTLNQIQLLPIEGSEIHRGELLNQLEKIMEDREQVIEAMCNFIKQISAENLFLSDLE
jgi:hypothetical protein